MDLLKVDKDIIKSINEISVYDLNTYTAIELYYTLAKKVNEMITNLLEFEINVSDDIIKQNERLNYLLTNGLKEEIIVKVNEMIENGQIEEIINERIFNKLNEDILECLNEISKINNNVIIITPSLSIEEINILLTKGGTFIFKNGDYNLSSDESINVCSNSHIIVEPNAILKQTTLDSVKYIMLNVENCENVVIDNPNIVGCKDEHIGNEGEWGYGIEIASSTNIIINKPHVSKCWGDGIYIGYKWNSENSQYRTDHIIIDKPIIKECRRNGISVCSGDNIKIFSPHISDIKGTAPQMGIDIEPENSNKEILHLDNLYIENPLTINCGTGIGVMAYISSNSKVKIVNHNDFMSTSSFLYDGLPNENWEVDYINPRLHPSRNGITIRDKGLNSKINIVDTVFTGKGTTPSGADYSTDYMITISNKHCNNRYINIDGLKMNKGSENKFPVSIVSINQNGYTNDFKISNVTLDGVPMYLENPVELYNIDNVFKNNYYQLNMSSAHCCSGHLYTNISTWEHTLTIHDTLPNGEYTITVLGSSIGASLSIRKQGNVTFYPTDENKTLSCGKLTFYKDGNKVIFL